MYERITKVQYLVVIGFDFTFIVMKYSMAAILLGVLILNSFAQNYIAIPDSNVVWRESSGFGHNIDNNTTASYFQLYPAAKVTFDTLEYFEIRKTGYTISMIPFLHGGFTNKFVNYLRNDSAQQRVYIRDEWGVERILYDFNLQPGDTIPHSWSGMHPDDSVVVDSIKTVWFGNVPHRWFALSCYTSGDWLCSSSALIEGVGCIHGLLSPISNCIETGWYNLACFSRNDSAFAISNNDAAYAGTTCWLYSDVKPLDNSPYALSVSPNPFGTLLHLRVDKDLLDGYDFFVYEVTGKSVTRQHVSSFLSDISSADWLPGIYFWIATSNGLLLGKGKLVKE